MSPSTLKENPNWTRFSGCYYEEDGFSMDWSQMNMPALFLEQMTPAAQASLEAMEALEGGAIANPDENRMVGHYWLRDATLAPAELQSVITETRRSIARFVDRIHSEGKFDYLLSIGIGGSALGPQFLINALAPTDPPLKTYFFDNTDPDGMARTLDELGEDLARTLVVVISKSGGTPETLNGMKRAQSAYKEKGLDFAKNAVAITGDGSKLDELAQSEGWLARFPMWDWVGGRTSVTSAVGLVPLALAGVDVDALLEGAARMDALTRNKKVKQNPGALLALCWYFAGAGRGDKAMVVLPYRDRMALFAKYLQQLVMESLGKELDRRGRVVHQGIAVYGNKGSTDQHAYVQQLREGVNDFFATFVVALEDGADASFEVEAGITPGDFLRGFYQGTRQALAEQDRLSLTLTVPRVDARTLGQLIALYERAVGLYAELVDINAYHQPGVEAGKKAAATILKLQSAAVAHLKSSGASLTAPELAEALGEPAKAENLFAICRHLAANGRLKEEGEGLERKFSA